MEQETSTMGMALETGMIGAGEGEGEGGDLTIGENNSLEILLGTRTKVLMCCDLCRHLHGFRTRKLIHWIQYKCKYEKHLFINLLSLGLANFVFLL